MAVEDSNAQAQQKPLRLWPGVATVALVLLLKFIVPIIYPEAMVVGIVAGLVGWVVVVVWWSFFSRAPRSERWSAIVLMIVALAATWPLTHVSIKTGMMGLLFIFYALPGLSFAFVAWAVVSRRLAPGPRRVALVAVIVIACGAWTLVQTAGFTGDGNSDFSWRWAQTAEDRLLAEAGDDPIAPPPAPAPVATAIVESAEAESSAVEAAPTEAPAAELAAEETTIVETAAEWPGFRGPARDSIIPGVQIETDWSASPPEELWRRAIGPGWSSFSVRGDLFYTQEQRGEDEVVSCYNMTTGEPVWIHRDPARFWESNAGAGPRGTPTLSGSSVYALGGTGIVNALDAATGEMLWSRNAATDTGAKLPGWGFAGSPLVVDDLVIVATSGTLIGYEIASGEPRWRGPVGGEGYSSPHLATIDGVEQVLLITGDGIISVAPADGKLLWEHDWSGNPIVQPALTPDGDVLVSVVASSGTRRLAAAQASGEWTVEERWTTNRLKPYFNDFVIHEGHAFGFDGAILACVDLAEGKRIWKGGRYGNGQLVLLADQDLLLVLSEEGELALVNATPDKYTELARAPAIEGKTWNHPVLVDDVLLVRNSEEMAAFRLKRILGTSRTD